MAKYLKDFRKGDNPDFGFSLRYQNSESKELIEQVDLTGFIISIAFSDGLDEVPFYQKDFALGEHFMDIYSNEDNDEDKKLLKAFIHLSSEDTEKFPVGKFNYEVQFKAPSGAVRTFLPPANDYKDKIRILPELNPQ